jgi:hypothetical protein
MSAPALEGGQDDDDILGFPGDGFVDKTDVNPGVLGEQDEEGDDASNRVAWDLINFQKVKIIERKRCGLEVGWEGSCRCICGSLGLLLCSTNAPHLS